VSDDYDSLIAEGVYDGPAVLTMAGVPNAVRVRLTGHLDPIDGHYHWQGMIFGDLPGAPRPTGAVTLAIGAQSATARIVEQTPWGTYSIAGIGAPPYPLDAIDI
jgi:hypothetical protein